MITWWCRCTINEYTLNDALSQSPNHLPLLLELLAFATTESFPDGLTEPESTWRAAKVSCARSRACAYGCTNGLAHTYTCTLATQQHHTQPPHPHVYTCVTHPPTHPPNPRTYPNSHPHTHTHTRAKPQPHSHSHSRPHREHR